MANRYVRSTGGNWNAAETWESSPGAADVVAIPTNQDDVYLIYNSGQLTINAAATCRSFDATGYGNTITHNNSITLTIGTSSNRDNNYSLILSGTYIPATAASTITFNSTASATLNINYNKSIVGNQNFTNGNYILQDNFVTVTAATVVTHTNGVLDFNSKTMSGGILNSTGTNTRTITFGNAQLYLSQTGAAALTFSGSNLSISANNAIIYLTGASPTFAGGGTNFNGTSLYIQGPAGTCTIQGNNTLKDLKVQGTSTKTVIFTAGTTTTITGKMRSYGWNGYKTINTSSAGSNAIIAKATPDTFNFYNTSFKDIHFSNITANLYNNTLLDTNTSGINFYGGNWYLDYTNGSDSELWPYGWWKTAFTSASGTLPISGETMQGLTSNATAKITSMVDEDGWNNGTGWLFFYGKSGTFLSGEILSGLIGGGYCTLSGDLTNAAWRSITGARAAQIAGGDTLRIAKSPDPTNTGLSATWYTIPGRFNGATPIAKAIVSTTNTTPITATATGHSYITGDIVTIDGHLINTNANGTWLVTNTSTDTFELGGSSGNGIGLATGNILYSTHRTVLLNSPVTTQLTNCTYAWNPGTNVTSSLANSTNSKEGYFFTKVIVSASHAASGILASYPLSGDFNLSGYTQISLWYQCSTATNLGDVYLNLYSDGACTSLVESFALPAIVVPSYWHPITLNKGSALASSVKGIALVSSIAVPSKTFLLDHIIACKDPTSNDSISLQSLISKNPNKQGGDEAWYSITAIVGNGTIADKAILLGAANNAFTYSTNAFVDYLFRGYHQTGQNIETAPLYKKETIKTDYINSDTTASQTINKGGLSTSAYLQLQGGYNTLTNIQDGETIFDGITGRAYGLYFTGKSYLTINYLNFYRYRYGLLATLTNTYINLTNSECSCNSNNIQLTINNGYINNIKANNSYNNNTYLICNNTIVDTIICVNGTADYTGSQGGLYFNTCSNCNINLIKQLNGNRGYSLFLNTVNNTYFNTISSIDNCGDAIVLNTTTYNNYFNNIGTLDYAYNGGIYIGAYGNNTFNTISSISSGGNGGSTTNCPLKFNNTSSNKINYIGKINYNKNSNYTINFITATNNIINKIDECYNNGDSQYGICLQNNSINNYINSITTSGHSVAALYLENFADKLYLNNASILENTEFKEPTILYQNNKVYSTNHDKTPGNNWIFTDGGTINSQNITTHTSGNMAWKISITDTIRTSAYPIDLSLAKVAVNAGSPVNVYCYCKLDNANTVGANITCASCQLSGIDTDYIAYKSANTDWENLSFTFTPNISGVIEIKGNGYYISGNDNIYFADINITQ